MDATTSIEKLYVLYEDTIVDVEKLLQKVIEENDFIDDKEEAAEIILRENEEEFLSMF